MSEKMKKFLNKQSPKKVIINEEFKLPNNLLSESVKVKQHDKEALYQYIEKPTNITYVLSTYSNTHDQQDRTIQISRKSGNRVIVILHNELEEISDFIVEMCDQMGWKFVSGYQRDTNKIIFTIFVQ